MGKMSIARFFAAVICVASVPVAGEAAVEWWTVPAMSGERYMPDRDPVIGKRGAPVRIVMAKEEYEPASFVLKSDRDIGKTDIRLSKLVSAAGDVFPAGALDLKVVKVWFQNGNSWFNYFGESGRRLCPELLLHDENLIRVDIPSESNYARIGDREQWINPPRQVDPGFESMRPEFSDAETLQPVDLTAGFRKQFFLTAHATRATPAGLYRGEILVSKTGVPGEPLLRIPLAIRVFDFVLPPPKGYVHPETDFLSFFYQYNQIHHIKALNGGDEALAWKQLEATLRDYLRHGQDMHWIPMDVDWKLLDLMHKVGMRTDVVAGGVKVWDWFCMTNNSPAILDRRAAAQAAWYDRKLGHHNVFFTYADEPLAEWWIPNRWIFDAFTRHGFRGIIAAREDLFWKMHYGWGLHVVSGDPGAEDGAPGLWNKLGSDTLCAWYAGLHVGPENPDFNRRQYGMAAYLGGYSANCNYAHHYGPYNDDTNSYKPMVMAYGCGGGVIDTLQWEGFREGIDDIRYATEMCRLARAAAASKRFELSSLGRRALGMLAGIDRARIPLDELRAEMTRYILELGDALGPERPGPLFRPENPRYKEGACGWKEPVRADPFFRNRAPQVEKDVAGMLAAAKASADPGRHIARAVESLVRLCTFVHSDNCVGRGDWQTAEKYWRRICDLMPRTTNFVWKAGEAVKFAKFRRSVGDRTGAIALYDAAMKDPAAKTSEKLLAALLKGFVTEKDENARIAFWRRSATDLKASEKDFDAALLAAAKDIGGVGTEKEIRSLALLREKSFAARPPKKVCKVRFSDRPVAGAAGFAALEPLSDAQKMDRAFGGRTDYFATDVSVVRTTVGKGSSPKEDAPRLDILADAWGLHFRMSVRAADAREIAEGFSSGPSLEAYVVPGEDASEICIFSSMRTGDLRFYNTSYDSEFHRRADASNTLSRRQEVVFDDGGYVCYYALSWDNFATRIPKDGDEWDFEQTLWGKKNFCWNGIENVHSRSSMGKLRFVLTDAQRAAIFRSRLARAKTALVNPWTGEKKSFEMKEGIFDHWADPVIGDREFYAKAVKPIETKLDGACKKIVPGMSDALTLDLAESVYPVWENLRLVIGRARADYLREKWTQPEKKGE